MEVSDVSMTVQWELLRTRTDIHKNTCEWLIYLQALSTYKF